MRRTNTSGDGVKVARDASGELLVVVDLGKLLEIEIGGHRSTIPGRMVGQVVAEVVFLLTSEAWRTLGGALGRGLAHLKKVHRFPGSRPGLLFRGRLSEHSLCSWARPTNRRHIADACP